MKIFNSSTPVNLAEIKKNENRKEKSTDVLMRAGVKILKNGPNQGKMVGLLQSVSDHGPKILRNILMGRAPATKEDIKNVLRTEGMSDSDITTVLQKIKSDTKGRFTVKAFNDAKDELSKTKPSILSENNGKISVAAGEATQINNFIYTDTVQTPIDDYDPNNKL
jgi:hypothetical protein